MITVWLGYSCPCCHPWEQSPLGLHLEINWRPPDVAHMKAVGYIVDWIAEGRHCNCYSRAYHPWLALHVYPQWWLCCPVGFSPSIEQESAQYVECYVRNPLTHELPSILRADNHERWAWSQIFGRPLWSSWLVCHQKKNLLQLSLLRNVA